MGGLRVLHLGPLCREPAQEGLAVAGRARLEALMHLEERGDTRDPRCAAEAREAPQDGSAAWQRGQPSR